MKNLPTKVAPTKAATTKKTIGKIFATTIFTAIFTSTTALYATCLDAGTEEGWVRSAKRTYDKEVEKIEDEIEDLNDIIKDEITENEKSAKKEIENLITLEKEAKVKAQKSNFYLQQQNEIQGIINNIKALK